MPCLSLIAILLALFVAAPSAIAEPPSAERGVLAALDQWTSDFNAGRADKVCDLVAASLFADVRGAAERDFSTQCRVLRQTLADPDHSYLYAFRLKEILPERDMAAVRLTWTMTTRNKATGAIETTEDEGLDVFRRGADGQVAHPALHGL